MEDAALYKQQMIEIERQIKKKKEEKEKHLSVYNQLNRVSNSLISSADNLKMAESIFQGGGYYVSGQTPMNGASLNLAMGILEEQYYIVLMMSNIQEHIAEYESTIASLKVAYDEAYANYLNASGHGNGGRYTK